MYFDETKPDVVVNILGTDYAIYVNYPPTKVSGLATIQ